MEALHLYNGIRVPAWDIQSHRNNSEHTQSIKANSELSTYIYAFGIIVSKGINLQISTQIFICHVED